MLLLFERRFYLTANIREGLQNKALWCLNRGFMVTPMNVKGIFSVFKEYKYSVY